MPESIGKPGEFQIGLERMTESPSAIDSNDQAIAIDFDKSVSVALLSNRSSLDHQLRFADEVLHLAGIGQLTKLFAPQHGFWSDAQANMIETPHEKDARTGLTIHSLYSNARRPTPESLEGVDVLFVDLQDVGVRVYTFIWTVLECMHACAQADVKMIVLDRPNPIGGQIIEGPCLKEEFKSFVGNATIPMRHGLTIGELCRLLQKEAEIDIELSIVPMQGWRRETHVMNWERPWHATSPNLPRHESLMLYPGQVLLEGVNLSEGRGTTLPFEFVGAPFIDPNPFASELNALELPGIRFLPARFTPSFDKWQSKSCGGVSIHVTDATKLRSYAMSVAILRTAKALYPDHFSWNEPPYEYEYSLPPIDIISGDRVLREAIDQGESLQAASQVDLESWRERVADCLLYGDAAMLIR